MANNIVLIGMPGTGKTSVGREIATLLGWNFVDTDAEIVGRTGRSIAVSYTHLTLPTSDLV